MKNNPFKTVSKLFLVVLTLSFFYTSFAQQQSIPSHQQNNFWQNVQFGGGLGLSIGSGYTDISVSPSAIYNINSVVAVGTSLQFGYVSARNNFSSTVYGASLIGLINPIPEIQLSAELEEVNVNLKYKNNSPFNSENFWNTALYLGAGYRTGNVTVGVRYNVLFDENKNYYNDAFMPFVRVYF
ncbi:hypothetical protein [Flavobacterium eburneipallidum]|uniref:hypothetical protein n=1 Tax=Flavobacterium eburneipallidum TaxID=3003263 RepID=UPI0022AC8908|nr:hypothetical protein [Flavobacterium eburneipallidum]